MKLKKLIGILSACFFLPCTSFGWDLQANQFELSGSGGFNWLTTASTTTVISATDTESNHVTNTPRSSMWNIGLGWNPINYALLEANYYSTTNAHINGVVWDYGNPLFNNYSFSAPITSSRLMFDVKPMLTYAWLSPYAILGIGNSWNNTSYYESPADGGNLSLSSKVTQSLAYEFGGGFRIAIVDNFSIQIEYLWASLGHATPSNNAGSVPMISPPKFALSNQSILAGLSITI